MQSEFIFPKSQEFLVHIPPDYFIKKFNYLAKKNNALNGFIRNAHFNGTIGPDFYPMNFVVVQLFRLKIEVEEKNGKTLLRMETSLNPTFFYFTLAGMLLILIAPILFSLKKDVPLDGLWYVLILPLGLIQWVVFKNARATSLRQFSRILTEVERSYARLST